VSAAITADLKAVEPASGPEELAEVRVDLDEECESAPEPLVRPGTAVADAGAEEASDSTE
jgi:hypothetical protein